MLPLRSLPHRPSVLFLGAALLCLLPAARGQQFLAPHPKSGVKFIERSPLVTIGDGVHSQGRFQGSDELPFLAAIAALPDGGTILVGQGEYSFATPVQIAVPHISIQGPGAVLHSSGDASVGLFDVTGDHFRMEALELHDQLPAAGHALVRVNASNVHIRACTFDAGDAAANTPAFIELTADGFGQQAGFWVDANSFHPARGWTLLRAHHVFGLHLTSNVASAESLENSGGLAHMAYGFRLENVEYAEIRGNDFLTLGDMTDPVQAAIWATNGGEESHHLVIAQNAFHTLTAVRIVHLLGAHYDLIAGNTFGRNLGTALLATIDIGSTGTPPYSDSNNLTIEGNDFHNPGNAPVVRINGGTGFVITGNHLSLGNMVAVIVGDIAPANDVSVLANHFASKNPNLNLPAVAIVGGARHVIQSNTTRDYLRPSVQVLGVVPANYVAINNVDM